MSLSESPDHVIVYFQPLDYLEDTGVNSSTRKGNLGNAIFLESWCRTAGVKSDRSFAPPWIAGYTDDIDNGVFLEKRKLFCFLQV